MRIQKLAKEDLIELAIETAHYYVIKKAEAEAIAKKLLHQPIGVKSDEIAYTNNRWNLLFNSKTFFSKRGCIFPNSML